MSSLKDFVCNFRCSNVRCQTIFSILGDICSYLATGCESISNRIKDCFCSNKTPIQKVEMKTESEGAETRRNSLVEEQKSPLVAILDDRRTTATSLPIENPTPTFLPAGLPKCQTYMIATPSDTPSKSLVIDVKPK